MRRSHRSFGLIALAALALAAPASATFHLMQIEEAVGGMCGDTAQQAIQLRMRSGGQNQVSGKQLIAYDANGANPVILATFPSNVTGSSGGSRILAVTSAFAAAQGMSGDFTLTNRIPDAYLAAGRLTFEGNGAVVWSLSWGGAAYTGSNAGSTDNDADGNYGPPWPFAMPSDTDMALQFQGAFNAMSTNNAADYDLSNGEAIFTRNNGSSFMVIDCFLFGDGFESGTTGAWSQTLP